MVVQLQRTANTSRRPEIIIVLSFAVMFAIELFAHWALASDLSPRLRTMYLSNSKLNSITMLVDDYLPSATLGFLSGWVAHRWVVRKLNAAAVLLALGVTGVHFLYATFFPRALLWWWPPEWGEGLLWFATGAIFTLFFAHLGRNFHTYREGGTL